MGNLYKLYHEFLLFFYRFKGFLMAGRFFFLYDCQKLVYP